MARVLGMHELELRPGASAEEFERFFREEVVSGTQMAGIHVQLLKADRGARDGKYLLLVEVESQALRDQTFPLEGEASAEAQAYDASAEVQQMWAHWGTLATVPGVDTVWTDYVVVAPDN